MKRYTALMLALFLAMSADVALGGGGHGGGHSGGHHNGRAVVGARPAQVSVARPHFFRRSTVIIGGAVVVGAPFYPYPYYPYPYPYYAPAYVETPAYVEQGGTVYYYCPDYRDYYPNVASCPSPWMKVLP